MPYYSIIIIAQIIILLIVLVFFSRFVVRRINRPKNAVDDSADRTADYQNTIINRKTLRKWAPAFLFCLICGLLAMYLCYPIEHGPEAKLAKDFISSNDSIRNYFGNVQSISFSDEGTSSENIGLSGRKGECYFDINGDKKTGIVRVRWESKGSGVEFHVRSVEVLSAEHNFLPMWSP